MGLRSSLRGFAALVLTLTTFVPPPAGAADGDLKPDFGDPPAATSQPADEPAKQAAKQLQRGMELLAAGKILEARTELSAALLSGRLEGKQEDQAAKALTDLADKTLLSTAVYEGDPYAYAYTLRPGDVVNRVAKAEKCCVSPELILKINGVADARNLQAGQQLKMIRGPVHAVISKGTFTMDLYLQRDDQPKVFLKRLRVGLGKAGGTPEGAWRVAGKVAGASWTPPPDHPLKGRVIRPTDPLYPLGKDGLWISLEGTDQNTQGRTGYGIHGTNDASSIGKAESHGCVRLGDEDIRLVFSLLAEKLSTVQIRQ